MTGRAVEVSVVLPAYDEAGRLRDAVETTLETLAGFLPRGSYEVIVAEDGCSDRTPAIAADLAAGDDRVAHVHSDERLGRGRALEAAFRRANGETLVYFDADLATDVDHLEELVESVRSGEYDVATGSRRLAGDRVDRPLSREIPSAGYNALVKLLLRSDLSDHQCGFKAFDRDVLFALLPDVEDEHWFWDTELLVRAQRADLRVKEFPVDWTPTDETSVDLVRDVIGMGGGVLRTWWGLSVSPRITRRTSTAAGAALALLALVLMTRYLDPRVVASAVAGADLRLVAVAAIVYCCSWPLRGLRYREILATLGYRERVGFLTGAIFVSQTGNLVFPARLGDGVRAYVLHARRDLPYSTGVASLAVERAFDLLSLAALAATVFLGLAAAGGTSDLEAALYGRGFAGQDSGRTALLVAVTVGTAAVVATGLVAATARSETNYVRRLIARRFGGAYARAVADVLERFAGDVQRVACDRRALVAVSATSLLVWALDVLVAVLVLAAFGVGVPAPTLLAVGFVAVSVGNLAKVLPLSPGGIGLYEGAFAVFVVGLAPVTAPVAVGAAVVDHALKNVVTVLGGAVSMVVLNVSLTTAVDESADVRESDPTAAGGR